MNPHPLFRGGLAPGWTPTLLLIACQALSLAVGQPTVSAAPDTNPALLNRPVLDIAPGPGNPRNSEGAFLDLPDGRILFIYSKFVGDSFRDFAKARLAARYSSDGGDTWSEDTIIASPEEDRSMNVMSVSLLRMKNGDVGLFYLLRRSMHDMRMQLRRSADEGATWGAPVQCMPATGIWVVNNDRVVRLTSGRLIIPAALHRLRADASEAEISWNGPMIDKRCVDFFFLSDDDGRTWREASNYCTLQVPHTEVGLQEPGVVELPHGVLWGWARTDLSRQYEFFSFDGGETWSEPQPSRFTAPVSPLSMKRIPGSDRFLAIWTPAPNFETRRLKPIGGDRTPFVGATGQGPYSRWTEPLIFEGDEELDAGYGYAAIHFLKDAVLLAYDAGNVHDKGRLNRLRIRKMSLDLFK